MRVLILHACSCVSTREDSADVLSKAALLKLGRQKLQLQIKDLEPGDLRKYCTVLALPHVSDPSYCAEMKVDILEAVPNERVAREDLLSDGVTALQDRLCDATWDRRSCTGNTHPLLSERQPGLLRDCAKAMGVTLTECHGERQLADKILEAVKAHLVLRDWCSENSRRPMPPHVIEAAGVVRRLETPQNIRSHYWWSTRHDLDSTPTADAPLGKAPAPPGLPDTVDSQNYRPTSSSLASTDDIAMPSLHPSCQGTDVASAHVGVRNRSGLLLNKNTALRVLSFSPEDRTAKIWNTATGDCILTLAEHTREVRYANFSPDGSLVLTLSSDMTA